MDKIYEETRAEEKGEIKGEHFDESKKKELAASDKGSRFDQPSSDISGVSRVSHPSTSNEVGASSRVLKLMASKASTTSGLAESDSTSGDESNGNTESEELECEDELNTRTVVDRLKINSKLQEIASCRFCGTHEIRVDEKSRCGLGAEWSFMCRNSEYSSRHISCSFHTTPKENRVYGINRGLVLALRLIGRGHSAAERLMSVLNLPIPVGRAPWSSHTKTLLKAANELLDTEFSNAALEVKQFKIANGRLAVGGAEKSDQELRELVVEAGASIDGSWSSRGWSARDGVVAAVSVDTGKVLDVVYLNKLVYFLRPERDGTQGRYHLEEAICRVVPRTRRKLFHESRRHCPG